MAVAELMPFSTEMAHNCSKMSLIITNFDIEEV